MREHALRQRSGQATLSFILLVSGVILEVAIAGSFVAYFFSASGYGERVSSRALAAARAGFADAEIQIGRNKEYGGGVTTRYTFAVGSDTVEVTVSRMTDAGANAYVFTVSAVGTSFTRTRELTAAIVVDRTTGVARVQSLREKSVD
ncbi:MAG: hypothetical protein HYU81_02365 [Candidatus Brennerbacteria bacterium]|nr:hypothetical protein [Candidatus Brennerbacteria bacterium]